METQRPATLTARFTTQRIEERFMSEGLERHNGWWTTDETEGHRAIYFAPANRTAPPYLEQREVQAILDIASDGTLAGVELVWGDLPPIKTGV